MAICLKYIFYFIFGRYETMAGLPSVIVYFILFKAYLIKYFIFCKHHLEIELISATKVGTILRMFFFIWIYEGK